MAESLKANEGKQVSINIDGSEYIRLPIKTHLITDKDDIVEVAKQYGSPLLSEKDDVLFISEKCVACTQGRAIPLEDIHPRRLAKFLSRFVTRTPAGIGLGMPETMEYALKECGTPRILFAAGVSAVGKVFKRKGWFYDVAGYKAKSIDGPTPNTIPPYNKCVVLGPVDPDGVAKRITDAIGYKTIIVDINDLDGAILGAPDSSIDPDLYVRILKDNPLGQDCESTPMGIIRKVK